MTSSANETRSVVVEREIAHAPEKIWRALTEPHLIEEWLMKTDFKPAAGQKFTLRGDWGAVDCQVLEIEPIKALSYSWAAHGLESVVNWTLTPTSKGASGPIRSNSIRAPEWAGGTSSPSWSRSWREASDGRLESRAAKKWKPVFRKKAREIKDSSALPRR